MPRDFEGGSHGLPSSDKSRVFSKSRLFSKQNWYHAVKLPSLVQDNEVRLRDIQEVSRVLPALSGQVACC